MKRKTFIGIILTLCFCLCFVFYMKNLENNSYEERGNLLINKIETYRKTKNKLPNNLADLGIEEPMNEGAYYEKINAVNYKIYFTVGFDNSKVYYSESKRWKDE